MNAKLTRKDNIATLDITVGEAALSEVKTATLANMQKDVSAPGFRKGKVPLNLVEKQVDPNHLKSQFLDEALSYFYQKALIEHKLRPVDRPKVEIKKFAAFTELSYTVEVEVLPEITLPDYKKIKVAKTVEPVTKENINEVVENLRSRIAEKKSADRAAKKSDEVTIEFSGVDAKGKAVAGAKGKDYPLVLGSDTFIPGFEKNVIGMKKDEEKSFDLTFPADYAHKPLASKKVTFSVKIQDVKEVVLPKVDDEFAAAVGPFATVTELKDDIKKQLTVQKEQEADAKFKDSVIEQLAKKASFDPPKTLVKENIESILTEFKQNLVYRGITMSEYLEQAGVTEEEYVEQTVRPQAEQRVTIGLLLSEISEAEKIQVTEADLNVRIQMLQGQYGSDEAMKSQLETPEARREVAARMVTEQTIDALAAYAAK